jgi:hypothetical protein
MKNILLMILFFGVNHFAQNKSEHSNNITNELTLKNDIFKDDIVPKGSLLEIRTPRNFYNNKQALFKNHANNISVINVKPPKSTFINSDLFLVLVGSAVTFGAVAAYFKLESDISYEKYLDTNNKKYLKKTDNFDIYSGVALGVLEVNFGFLIYKFLTD